MIAVHDTMLLACARLVPPAVLSSHPQAAVLDAQIFVAPGFHMLQLLRSAAKALAVAADAYNAVPAHTGEGQCSCRAAPRVVDARAEWQGSQPSATDLPVLRPQNYPTLPQANAGSTDTVRPCCCNAHTQMLWT